MFSYHKSTAIAYRGDTLRNDYEVLKNNIMAFRMMFRFLNYERETTRTIDTFVPLEIQISFDNRFFFLM